MRCFIAIELSAEVRARLEGIQKRWRDQWPEVRWTRPDQIHLTLKFLGEVADAQLSEVCRVAEEVAGGISRFDMAVSGLGVFPPGGPARIACTIWW